MTTDIFRVYAYDLNTDTLITELPANDLAFDSRLNDSGSISFVLKLSRPEVASRVKPLLPYNGNPFAVYVDRDGALVWGGIIWTWSYARASGDLSMQGKQIMSYFNHRKLAQDYSVGNPTFAPSTTVLSYATAPTTTLSVASTTGFSAGQYIQFGVENPEVRQILSVTAPNTITLTSASSYNHAANGPVQFAIDPAALVKQAVNDAQNVSISGTGSNIGVTVVGGTSSITPIVPGYPSTQNTPVSQLISDMAAINQTGAGTVDTTIASDWVAGSPANTLTIWSPRAGRVGSASGLILDLSRSLDYTWPSDANNTGTNFTITGGNSLTSTTTSGAPVGGLGQMPRLDKVVSFSSIQTQSQLDAMAPGVVQQYSVPVPSPSVTQPTSSLPTLGSFVLGDDVRIFIASDERFPSGLDEYWRIIQYAVKVPDEGVPTITFTLNKPPVY